MPRKIETKWNYSTMIGWMRDGLVWADFHSQDEKKMNNLPCISFFFLLFRKTVYLNWFFFLVMHQVGNFDFNQVEYPLYWNIILLLGKCILYTFYQSNCIITKTVLIVSSYWNHQDQWQNTGGERGGLGFKLYQSFLV